MNISIQCPACQHRYTVDDAALGPRAKCSQCGRVFAVVAAPALDDDDPFRHASFEPTAKAPTAPAPKWKLPPVPIMDNSSMDSTLEPAPVSRPAFGRKRRDRRTVATDTLASYILFLFVAASVTLGVYDSAGILSHMDAFTSPWILIANIWGWVVSIDALLFTVIGPMLLLGVWIASRIARFALVDDAYLRACAAVGPALALGVLGMLTVGPHRFLCLLSIIPALYLTLRIFFDLDWAQAAVGFATGVIACVLASLMGYVVVERMISAGALAQVRASFVPIEQNLPSVAPASVASTASKSASTPSSPARDNRPLLQLRDLVNKKINADHSMATREQLAPDVADLQLRLESLRTAFHDDPLFDDVAEDIAVLRQTVLALPSGKIDPSVFQEAPDAEDWTTGNLSRGRLAGEVSVGPFRFQPPLEMKLDSDASHANGDSPTWIDAAAPQARLSVSIFRRNNARQRRPVLSDLPAVRRAAESAGYFAIDTTQSAVSFGQINGLFFTRVTTLADAPGPHAIVYAAAVDNDRWLIVRLELPPGNGPLPKIMDAAARTIRQMDASPAGADQPPR
ncbi:MAG TPA: zinc-ribbon domain-containing protein [Tepidisphaeraceae bacterium]|jgi:predicted Zn finger-like uncharacterized protein|nr:zinc-ribbon domain-containing protein [Tepidisphaeraceae bacterium]